MFGKAFDWWYRWGRLIGAALFIAAGIYAIADDRGDVGAWRMFLGMAWIEIHEARRNVDRLEARCERQRESLDASAKVLREIGRT